MGFSIKNRYIQHGIKVDLRNIKLLTKSKPKNTSNDDKSNNDKIINKIKINYSNKRLDYKRFLVGESCKNFLTSCGCDPDIADIADRRTLTMTAINYRHPLFHFCQDLNMTTDQIVKKYKRVDRFSNDLAEIIHQQILRLVGRVNSGKIRGHTPAMFQNAVQKFCNANWININWSVIRKNIPFKNLHMDTNDVAYTREQIKKILLFTTDIRMKIAILFMSQARVGGRPSHHYCIRI